MSYMLKRGLLFKNNVTNNFGTSRCLTTNFIDRDSICEKVQTRTGYESVADFYAGKSLFITGATGFIGRLLVERLLYTCKDIDKVYILIRENKNANIQQRLKELIQNPVFTKLKETRPHVLSKLVPIAGDIGDPSLGMTHKDEQTLIEKVSVVFHSAANVKFRTPVPELMRINYEGTKKIMDLGKKMKNLDVFVHVSTAFNNSSNPVIEEIPYPSPRNIDDVYKIIANSKNDSKEIRELTEQRGYIYVFTKNMAEGYVSGNYGNMRTVIIRPSMVTSIYKDPLPGYTDSWVAGTGLLCDIANGLIRVAYGKSDVLIDVIPADYVCNFLIVAAAKHCRSEKLGIYNISTSHANPISWGMMAKLYAKEGKKNGYNIMPFPGIYFTESMWALYILTFLTQILPAFSADSWLRLTGRKPRYMNMEKQAIARRLFTDTGTAVSWISKSTRAREIISTLDDKDRDIFPCDPATINWKEYVPIYCKGVRDYMLGNNKL